MAKVFRHLPGWGCAAVGVWLGFYAKPWTYFVIFIACVIFHLLYKLVNELVLPLTFERADILFDSSRIMVMVGIVILSTALPTALWLESSDPWSTLAAFVVTIIGGIVALFVGATLNFVLDP